MKINEDFARYIISLMDIAIAERGESETDRQYREDIETFFTQIRNEREHKEFVAWVYKNKIENNPKVKAIRKKMEEGTKEGEDTSFSFADEYRKREAMFKELDDLREDLASRFIPDKKTYNEWRILRTVDKMLGKKKKEE